jgi:hypothetical protein
MLGMTWLAAAHLAEDVMMPTWDRLALAAGGVVMMSRHLLWSYRQ